MYKLPEEILFYKSRFERSSKMNQYNNSAKIAELSENDIDSINSFQSKLKTLDDKDVVLVAYEK